MFCIYCGSKLPEGANFCMTCGKKVEGMENTEAAEVKNDKTEVNIVPAFTQPASIKFVIAGNSIHFDGSFQNYTTERLTFKNSFCLCINEMQKNASKAFSQTYEKDKDRCIQVVSDFGNNVISWTYDWAMGYLVNNNVYDISKNRLGELCDHYWEKFYSFYNDFEEGYLAIIATKEEMDEYRRLRHASRGHWEGGGFGISGALKGAAMAGVLNAGGTILSGIGSAIGSAIDSSVINRDKKKYLTERKWVIECASSLVEGADAIYHAVYCMAAKRNGLSIPHIDAVAGKSYFENSERALGREKQIAVILNGLTQNPFSINGLKLLLGKIPTLEYELCRFVEFFTPPVFWNLCYKEMWKSFHDAYEMISNKDSLDARISFVKKEVDFLDNIDIKQKFLQGYSSKYREEYRRIYQADEQLRRTSGDGIVHKTALERDIYEREYQEYNILKKKAEASYTVSEKLSIYCEAKEHGFRSTFIASEISERFDNLNSIFQSKKRIVYLQNFLNKSESSGLQIVTQNAKAGDADAIFVLADIYLQGKLLPKDEAKAFRLFSKIAQQNHIEALARLGHCYMLGIGVDENYIKAYEFLAAAAYKESSYAQSRLGVLLMSVDANELGLTEKEANVEIGLTWLKTAAYQEDAEAQCTLARFYASGEHTEKNYEQALKWYQKSAENGYAPAYCDLAILHREGLGVAKDTQAAIALLEKAVELDDDPEIMLELAKEYRNFGRLKDALNLYTICAQKGNGKAYRKIAQMYQQGSGLPQDIALAIKWFKAGAEKGDSYSQWSLGRIYMQGVDTAQDYAESARWFQMGAENNHDNCQYFLGYFYEKGLGVPQNYEEAAKWYLRGVENDNTNCMSALAHLFRKGEGIPKDTDKAVALFKMGAESGNTSCQYALGQMYLYGDGVYKSAYEAAKWYRLGADAGDADCQTSLGKLYQEGNGVTRDYRTAVDLYLKAIEQGNNIAMNNLALMYENGQGVTKDHKTALKLLTLAMDAGNKAAAENYKKIKRIFD